MAIRNLMEEDFRAVLNEYLTPSQTIKTPERLFGRAAALRQIDRALGSGGRQIFIYGDRGVGKTSLALTAAYLHNDSASTPIYVLGGHEESFARVMKAVGDGVIDVAERFKEADAPVTLGATLHHVGASFKPGQKGRSMVQLPSSLNDALDIVRYVLAKRRGQIIVVVDEMERIKRSDEREKFAELIKNLPEIDDRVRFIFCGIANTVDELLGSHPSAGRILETIHLKKLHHDYLWEIIQTVAQKTGVAVDREFLIRISQLSDGFPHYVHLVGESMFWNAFDDFDVVECIKPTHFREGVRGALERTESTLKLQYEKATMKTKNTEDYEEALWALADRNSDRRQLAEVYDVSYKRIMLQRSGRELLPKEKFNQRMLAMRKNSHGEILAGYGSGWFGFRENIIRGYVRLRAESHGIELGREYTIKRDD